jgi:hypothetical protein
MATTDQQTRPTSRQSADDSARSGTPAWPTRDLERRGGTQPDATETPTEIPTEPAAGATPAAVSTPEPRTPETTMKTAEPTAQRAPATSRATSFLADLTRAMRAAAEAERSEVLARLRHDAEGFVEGMRGEFAAAADTCRARCDTDLAAIEAWCEAELARIRRETEQGMAQRRGRLEAELAAQSSRLDEGIARVGSTVDTFEGDMSTFFDRLLSEEDPSTFAVMARQLPEPPPFAPWPPQPTADSEAWTAPVSQPALDVDALAAAEAEAAAAVEGDDFAATDATTMTAPPAQATSPAPTGETAKMVVAALGLVSVASVSSFKRALGHGAGVKSVQVSSGPQGEFLFTLTCDAGLDLAAMVCALPGFEVEVRGSEQGAVQIVVRDLEADS